MFHVPFLPIAFTAWCAYGASLIHRAAMPHLAYLSQLKTLIQRQRDIEIVCEIYDIDQNESLKPHLEKYWSDMEALGFQKSGDYAMHTSSLARRISGWEYPPISDPLAPPLQSLSRCYAIVCTRTFVHPTHNCLGKISISIAKDSTDSGLAKVTVSTNIISLSEATKDCLVYYTCYVNKSQRESSYEKLGRHPRRLKTRLVEASPTQLLKFHLKRRAEIAGVAHIEWKTQLSIADCMRCDQVSYAYLRGVFEKLNALSLAWRYARLKREGEKSEWLGELEGKV